MEKFKGKTLVKIEGAESHSDEVKFYFSDGSKANMFHYQDCCEQVFLSDITGDIEDLIGTPLEVAEERTEHKEDSHYDESTTFTFYEFRTIKGSVTLRWVGTSNGYYSESVDINYYSTPDEPFKTDYW